MLAPTLVTACTSLPPEGAGLRLGRPCAASLAPTPVTAKASLDGRGHGGFTLLELLVVLAIMAMATAGVTLTLRDNADTALEREAQRLAALLESARAQSRMSAVAVRWRATPTGFSFDGITGAPLPSSWLGDDVRSIGTGTVLLGPEPIIGPQQIRLVSVSNPAQSLTLATDGIRPFSVLAEPPAPAGTP